MHLPLPPRIGALSALIALTFAVVWLGAACRGGSTVASLTTPSPGDAATARASGLPSPEQPYVIDNSPVSTDRPALDTLIHDLETQDVDALMALVVLQSTNCQTASELPECAGADPAAPVSAFYSGFSGICIKWLSAPDQIRALIAQPFADSARSSVYAVWRGTVSKGSPVYDQVLLTAGDKPSPTRPLTVWTADADGKLVGVDTFCDRAPFSAGEFGRSYNPARFIVPPRAACVAGETDSLTEVIASDPQTGGVFKITGYELDQGGVRTGERTIAQILTEPASVPLPVSTPTSPRVAEWYGGPTRPSQLVEGMRVRIHGYRLNYCDIQTWSITRVS
jgi:hypothetical protein